MANYESKFGSIMAKDIDKSKIYGTASNAIQGLNNVKISDSNASWNSENLTYEIKDNGVVMISNNGVPIGFTTLEALNSVSDGESNNSGALVPGEEAPADITTKYEEETDINVNLSDKGFSDSKSGSGSDALVMDKLSKETYKVQMDENFDENEVEITSGTITNESSVDATYDEATGEIVDEAATEVETTNPSTSGEELTIEVVKDDTAAEEVKEEHNDIITPGEGDSGEHLAADYEEETEELDDTESSLVPGEEAPDTTISTEYEPTEEEMYNQEAKDFGLERDIYEIAAEIDAMGGNNGHDIVADAKNCGNEEVFIENINNLLDGLEAVQAQFDSDGTGFTFQSTVFTGQHDAVGSETPTHGMGSKVDLKWYKDGVWLDVGNSSKEDLQYIKDVLRNNGLDVQFEKRNTMWGDVFLQSAKNVYGVDVSYDDDPNNHWGDGINIYYDKK